MMKRVLALLSATVWISISEFVQNQFLLTDYWIKHYTTLGLTFPSAPINGAIWGIWSLLFAILIYNSSLIFMLNV